MSRQSEKSAKGPLRLWLYGLGMYIPTVYFAWRYPLRGNSDKLTDLGGMAHYELDELVTFVGGIVILFGFYLLALRESRRLPVRQALPAVFACGAALAAVMAFMYPVNAIDIFIYVVRSRLFTEYGANPLVAYPMDYPDDPLMRFASDEWADDVSPYGPLWNLIAAPITFISGNQLAVALAGFKVLALLSLLAGGWVIVRTLLASRPADAATGALFYLWNPLVLWEGVGNGHNDVLMTLPLLLALFAWVKRWDNVVIPLLVVATLIKYVAVLLIPITALALWRRVEPGRARWRLVGWSVALSVIATALALYPFYDLAAIRNSIEGQSSRFLTSPIALAVWWFQERSPTAEIEGAAKVAGGSIMLATLAWQMVRLREQPSRLLRAVFEVMYVFLLIATWSFRSWYLIWPVGLAALLPWGWPAWRMLAWTAGAMSAYSVFIWWRADVYVVQNVGVAMTVGATVLLSLAELICRIIPHVRTGGYAGRMRNAA